jgi:tagatose-6-phosphate ketose/aldose isomerase
VSTADETATYREIHQQPSLWRLVAEGLTTAREELDAFLAPVLSADDLRIVLTGAGTSAFAGRVLAPALSRASGRRVEAVATTDIVSNPRDVFAQDVPTLLVSLARSGDSPESVAAAVLADQSLSAVNHLIVGCNENGALVTSRRTDPHAYVVLLPPESNDQGFAMTSSFTGMLLATWAALEPGRPLDIPQIAAAAERILQDWPARIADLAGRGHRRVVHLGSGPLAALAQEASLKLLELTAGKVIAFHDSSLGFRHGPKSVLDDDTLVFVYLSADPYTRAYDEDIAVEISGLIGADHVVAISATPCPRLDPAQVWVTDDSDATDLGLALTFVVVAQLYALQRSIALGLAPDNPFPGGEVNRVVKGVAIHPLS